MGKGVSPGGYGARIKGYSSHSSPSENYRAKRGYPWRTQSHGEWVVGMLFQEKKR